MNIAESVEKGRQFFGDRPALLFEGQPYSYAELDALASRVSNGLSSLGISAGDRVALLLPNSPEFVHAYLGIQKLGAIAVSINTSLKQNEIAYILRDSGAKAIIAAEALAGNIPEVDGLDHRLIAEKSLRELMASVSDQAGAREMPDKAPAAIVYTSGTTGVPKGATLSHGNVISNARAKQHFLHIEPQDRLLLFVPLYHCFGQNAILNAAFFAGATVVLHRRFDARTVLNSLNADHVSLFFGVPSTYIVLLEHASPEDFRSIRLFFSAAAILPREVETRWYERFGAAIFQGYGLTETSPFASYNHIERHKPGRLGTPITDVEMKIVDPVTGLDCAVGELGEIVVRGPNVMLGYWNRPEETAEAIRDGWFHSGDLGRMDEEGYFSIEDRLKDMISVGAVKVYPAEVENAILGYPEVSEVAVYGLPDPVMGERVAADVVLKQGSRATPEQIAAFCEERMARFKIPSTIILAEAIPKNPTGKVLKRVLRERNAGVRESPAASAQDTSPLREWLLGWLGTNLKRAPASLDSSAPFADYGMDSLLAVRLATALSEQLGRSVAATVAWRYSTVDALADHLSSGGKPATERPAAPFEPIAIVGMACRLPGADGLEAYWQLLMEGRDAVTEIPQDRWDARALYDPDPNRLGKSYGRWGGFLKDLDRFDAAAFGISPREAPHVDPRQRLMLECAWEALEDAGLPADRLAGSSTGVFVAVLRNDYDALISEDYSMYRSFTGAGTANSIVANRVSFFFDFHGPSLALDTACSGSLYALHLACRSLQTGDCTLALAGGVSVNLQPNGDIFFSRAGALSPGGHCRPFDSRADGIVRSEGAGMLVLKPLSRAIADGDPIRAVIRGSAVNHDGRSNGIMAPNGLAQRDVMKAAYLQAGIAPSDVQYVEAHGTGTRLGDVIEAQSLAEVLGAGRGADAHCRVGSVKPNIGHSEPAAGVAGIIKVALALERRVLPGMPHFDELNPLIAQPGLPFDIQRSPGPWPDDSKTLAAGVSSFGFGGANGHVVLTQGEFHATAEAGEDNEYLLPLSARNDEALRDTARKYGELLRGEGAALRDICYTAGSRRMHHERRLAIVARTRAEMASALEKTDVAAPAGGNPSQPVFVFPGDGNYWAGMCRTLMKQEAVFRKAAEECEEYAGFPLTKTLTGIDSSFGEGEALQPTLFAIQVALAALWRSWGIEPGGVWGQGPGEAAAAYVAGALSLRDAMSVLPEDLRRVSARPAHIRLISGTTGRLQSLIAEGFSTFLEIGPHSQLTDSIGKALADAGRDGVALASMRRGESGRATMLASLGDLYVRGAAVRWDRVTPGGNCVSLPSYRWQRQRYWLDQIEGQRPPAEIRRKGAREFTTQDWSFLADHRVFGSVAMPAAAFVDVALHGRSAVSDMRFVRMLKLGSEARTLRIENDGAAFEICSRAAGETGWTVHATGRLDDGVAMTSATNLDAARERIREVVPVEQHYAGMRARGVEYGPAFQSIRELWRGDREAIALLRLSPECAVEKQDFLIHPALLDGCFQCVAACLDAGGDVSYLPAALESVRIHEEPGTAIWCHARLRSGSLPGNQKIEADLDLWTSEGRHAAAVRGLELTRIGARDDAGSDVSDWIYQVEWRAQERVPSSLPTTATGRKWAILNDQSRSGDRLADEIRARGDRVRVIESPFHCAEDEELVDLRGLDAESPAVACAAALEAVKAAGRKLWLITRGAVNTAVPVLAQAALWGFGKVVAHEYPGIWGGMIDLDSESDPAEYTRIADELGGSDDEDQIAFREGKRVVPRLEHRAVGESALPGPRFPSDATFLITGGFTGLGLETARWMARRGARRLILAARTALPARSGWATLDDSDPAARRVTAVRELEAMGVAVQPWEVNVADEAALSALFRRHREEAWPPIRGVVHCAGVVRDELIVRMDPASFSAVMSPKTDGAWNLHRLTEDLQLDFFVMFSSVSSVLGNVGQANYAAANAFLDGLAHLRHAAGLPAMSINWGPWSGTGMLADAREVGKRTAIQDIDPASGVEALSLLFTKPCAQAVVVRADWQRLERTPLLGDLQHENQLAEDGGETGTGLLELLLAEPGERRGMLVSRITEMASATMYLEPGALDMNRSLTDLGMDSIMALELKERIEADLGLKASLGDLFTSSVTQLAELLEPQINSNERLAELVAEMENLSHE